MSKVEGKNAFGHSLVVDLMVNPTVWKLWAAVAVVRWLERQVRQSNTALVYRSNPSLAFAPSEIHDIALDTERFEIVINALGPAASGSALPTADVARIIRDARRGGALGRWLDGGTNTFAQIVESNLRERMAPFSASMGKETEGVRSITTVVGDDAGLSAEPDGARPRRAQTVPHGALALAGLFLGPPSAAGLRTALEAITGLVCRVREFAGAKITVERPARAGHRMEAILGRRCISPAAGVEATLKAGEDAAGALEWARNPAWLEGLTSFARSYTGSAGPEVRLVLEIAASVVPPAALDANGCVGGGAVLGRGEGTLRLPLAERR